MNRLAQSAIPRELPLYGWVLTSSIAIVLLYAQSIAAQVVPDNTLPVGEQSQVTGNATVQIDGGARRGDNLFHSFSQFSIPTGGSAFFNNAAAVQNIFSRVTGGSVSNIDGVIRANGTANLFLLNPNGILFGPNASLNIGGSFVATTANAIGFPNGEVFSSDATQPLPSQLLNVNANALFFNQLVAQAIVNQSTFNDTGLQVPLRQNLLLVGGPIQLDGGRLISPGSYVELGSVGGKGTVGLATSQKDWQLNIPSGLPRADALLRNGGDINVKGDGGSIRILAQNIDIFNSSLRIEVPSDSRLPATQTGNLELNATGSITMSDSSLANSLFGEGTMGNITLTAGDRITITGSQLFSTAEPGSVGNIGDVTITARTVLFSNTLFVANTSQQTDASDVFINARDTVSVDSSLVFNTVEPTGVGKGGDINITTGSVSLTNGTEVISQTSGQGNAGGLNINAHDTVSVDGSLVFNTVESTGVGKGGDINITTGSISLTNGAQMISNTSGQGNAGGLNINAHDTVSVDGSLVFNTVESTGVGKGGDINITTGSVSLTNGTEVTSNTNGQGNAGSVSINARDRIWFDSGSYVFNSVIQTGIGDGGDISITTGSLSFNNGAGLIAATYGKGDVGDINILVRDMVTLDGGTTNTSNTVSAISSAVENGGIGNGGTINIQAQQLILKSNAALVGDVFPNGRGQGGDINLNISGTILLLGGTAAESGESATITSRVLAGGIGTGGDIRIKAGALVLQNGGLVNASTQGLGDAGSLNIWADRVDISGSVPSSGLPSGLFTSSDTVGNAGDIVLNTQTLRIADGAVLSARSRGNGQGGNITVNAARTFETINGGQLITTTFGRGQAGSITVTAGERITIAGADPNYAARLAKFPTPISPNTSNAITEAGSASGLFANTEPNSAGRGGDIQITTGQFTVQGGAQLITSTSGSGRAGDITVNTPELQLSGATSGLFTQTTTVADAGNLTIQPRGNGQSVRVNLQDGAQISASTSSSGRGGTLTITAPDSVTLTGNGSVIAAETGGTGTGGNLFLTTGDLNIQNQAEVTVSSSATGSAGSLFVNANRILLDNQGRIRADTSGGGGNISLRSPLILLRNGSNITTNATGENIPGGNIDIDTRFLVAVLDEDSNISANSRDFRGGNVSINAFSIFGIQPSLVSTPLSDITATGATSALPGTIEVITAGIDPTAGIVQLPTDVVDPGLIAQGCPANEGNSFVITGRGGLPPTPEQQLGNTAGWQDRRRLTVTRQKDSEARNGGGRGDPETQKRGDVANPIDAYSAASGNHQQPTLASTTIIETTGWQVTPAGDVILVANTPNPTVQNQLTTSIACQGGKGR